MDNTVPKPQMIAYKDCLWLLNFIFMTVLHAYSCILKDRKYESSEALETVLSWAVCCHCVDQCSLGVREKIFSQNQMYSHCASCDK